MRSAFASAVASLAVTCDAFYSMPTAVCPRSTSLRLAHSGSSGGVSTEASTPTTAESDAATSSSYPGPVTPRVGGAMPEQRPGWFRVPAPGGKHTKVRQYHRVVLRGAWCVLRGAILVLTEGLSSSRPTALLSAEAEPSNSSFAWTDDKTAHLTAVACPTTGGPIYRYIQQHPTRTKHSHLLSPVCFWFILAQLLNSWDEGGRGMHISKYIH